MDRFNAEYVEKELQKQSALQVSIVWDKVCARSRQIVWEFYHSTFQGGLLLCAISCDGDLLSNCM